MLVGGDSEAAIARAVRIADGYFPGEGDADRLVGLMTRLRTAAEAAGRDPNSVGRIMVPAFFFAGPGGLDRLAEFGDRVIHQTA